MMAFFYPFLIQIVREFIKAKIDDYCHYNNDRDDDDDDDNAHLRNIVGPEDVGQVVT